MRLKIDLSVVLLLVIRQTEICASNYKCVIIAEGSTCASTTSGVCGITEVYIMDLHYYMICNSALVCSCLFQVLV